ncbi:uncharacterized protein LOC143289788 [Babylonia areolata]|uniref:uncharacterized protein LOC143289788 n=1 Tax=Babylonia areolata TaxID=304850 RepID=UPI003FD166F5
MEWSVLSCVLFVIVLSTEAEPVAGSSPQEDKSLSPDPDPAAFNADGKPSDMQEAMMAMLKTFVKQQVEERFGTLTQQLQRGDAYTKEVVLEGLAHVKEQRKDGDERLKEDLDEDFDWLKNKLAKVQFRFMEELEGMNQELTVQREALQKLRNSAYSWTQPCSPMAEDLRQQMSDMQADLHSTKQITSDIQAELNSTKEQMSDMQADLHSTKQITSDIQAELNSTKEQMSDILPMNASVGSTYIRWGRTTCPEAASLVYSGFAGGSWFRSTGGGSNYLCLVKEPQLDNMTLPSHHNNLYGAEYQEDGGHDETNVVCSVCRAPQSTSLMIPATVTCPEGWTTQYRGHLMSTHHIYPGRTEHVCVDENKENHGRNGDGATFYFIVTKCGSLPCPPYVADKVVTCVVCSV